MALSYNIEEIPPADAPCVEHDIRRAKKFLQRHSSESGDNLYDHLTELLTKILAEKPRNAIDVFEQISRTLKEERYKSQTTHFRDLYVPPSQYEDAKKLIKLFEEVSLIDDGIEEKIEDDETEEVKGPKPNMLDLLFYFEQTGIGMPRNEMVILNAAIRKFMAKKPVKNVRFWGKIFGDPKSYYVLEADLTEEELDRRLEEIEAEERELKEREEAETEAVAKAAEEEAAEKKEPPEEIAGEDEEKKLEFVFPPLPVNTWKPPPTVPAEVIGTGVNRKFYFVCNTPGLQDWTELPPVTPQQVVVARQILRRCTGNLETPVHTFPPFPGTEKNYLRAQIARISAATHVSPIGYFNYGGEDEEEEIGEEVGEGGVVTENVNYAPLPVKDLADGSMSNWCHHTQYILKQGRTIWWSPTREETEMDEEVEEEEEFEGERDARMEKEIGPPILTPLSEDAIIDNVVPWTARLSSQMLSDIAVALIRSNVWPGAYAFACGRQFANVYIGWGHKHLVFGYNPPPMPPVQEQYFVGPEIMEMQDPSFEDEEAYRIAHLPPEPLFPGGEEEELGEMDEEEEDEE